MIEHEPVEYKEFRIYILEIKPDNFYVATAKPNGDPIDEHGCSTKELAIEHGKKVVDYFLKTQHEPCMHLTVIGKVDYDWTVP